jgi:hypothetical protein
MASIFIVNSDFLRAGQFFADQLMGKTGYCFVPLSLKSTF